MNAINVHIILLITYLFNINAKRLWINRQSSLKNDCVDPMNLNEYLSKWIQESMEIDYEEQTSVEQWINSKYDHEICSTPPNAKGATSIMERSLCPWEKRINFEETRKPKSIVEYVCLCRKSRGLPGALCTPIFRKTPILRRVSCDSSSGNWIYKRTTQYIRIGCHSVFPRSKNAPTTDDDLDKLYFNAPI